MRSKLGTPLSSQATASPSMMQDRGRNREGLDDQRKAVRQVIAGPAVEPHLGAVLPLAWTHSLSNEMRALVDGEWPELAHKLPPMLSDISALDSRKTLPISNWHKKRFRRSRVWERLFS
jgi:hypothetical protein